MNYQITLSLSEILFSLAIGFGLCLVYLYLLWKTVLISKKASHPIAILFFSGIVRIFLLIFIALVFSQNNLSRFLVIFCGFLLTRVIVLKIAKPAFKKQVMSQEIVSSNQGKQASSAQTKKSSGKRKKSKK